MPMPRKSAREGIVILRRLAILLPWFATSACPTFSHAQPMALPAFTDMAQRCGSQVAALTLAAVAQTESRFEPLVVADNSTHRTYVGRTLEDAVSKAELLRMAGDNIDLGLMQINSNNLAHLNLTVQDALDPCRSIAGAASILSANYLAQGGVDSQTALRNALSVYNTGNATRGYRNGYVGRVQAAADALASAISSPSLLEVDLQTVSPPQVLSWDVWRGAYQLDAESKLINNQVQIF